MQIDSLYTSMAGLQGVNAQMQAIAANLANAQTPGYAAVQAMAEAAGYEGGNAPVGADAVAVTPGPDLTQGPLTQTGDPLNIGLGGDSWLTVQTTSGTALTRDGSLSISGAGMLTDSAGNPVLSVSGQPISLPALAKLQIGTDGTISGIPANQPNGQAQSFGQIAMVATPPGQLTALSGSLYMPPAGVGLAASTNGSMHQGYINGSNVDPTQSMMEMISESRSFQLQTDMMKTQAGNGQDLNNLLAEG